MKICIDPGLGLSNRTPGLYEPGATHTEGTTRFQETDIALKYALTLKDGLRARQIGVFMTRDDAIDPCPVGRRAARAEEVGCDMLISIHPNGIETLDRDVDAGDVEERVGQRRCGRGRAGFAHAADVAEGAVVLQDRDLETRGRVDPQRVIVPEIGLDRLLILERDRPLHGGGQAVDHRARHLRLDDAGVHRKAGIAGDPGAGQTDAALDILHFDHLGHRGAEGIAERHAAPEAGALQSVPARHLGHLVQKRSRWRMGVRHQVAPEGQRISACGMGHLVDEAFQKEGIHRIADRPPKAKRHGQVGNVAVIAIMRQAVGLVEPALDRRAIRAGRGKAGQPDYPARHRFWPDPARARARCRQTRGCRNGRPAGRGADRRASQDRRPLARLPDRIAQDQIP